MVGCRNLQLGQAGHARHIITSMWQRAHTPATISLDAAPGTSKAASAAVFFAAAAASLCFFSRTITRRGSNVRLSSRSSPSGGAQFAASSSSSASGAAARCNSGAGAGGAHQPTFKIFCRADEGFCLTVRDGEVVLAPTNPRDENQHWYKDMRYSAQIKDEEGNPAFALVNKATGLAIKHSLGQGHTVKLVRYNPEYLDESVMWTESGDVGKGFRCIRMVNNTRLNFDAFHADKDHGGVHDGTTVVLWEWAKGDNQSWKILPWGDEAYGPGGSSANAPRGGGEPTVRIFCKADEGFSVTVRDGSVCLAPTNPRDEHQHWIKDMRHSNRIKDEEGYPAFALVNRVTGEAIKHSQGEGHPVKLVPYNPNYQDESVLWTESRDVGHGFRCIRMVNNIYLNFDALHGDKDHGGVRDGTTVVLWKWCEGDNQRWKISPW